MSDLRICRACGCHVKAAEAACPFCQAPRTPRPLAAPAPLPRMSRAQLVLLGSTLAFGCASTSGGGGQTTSATGGQTTTIDNQTTTSSTLADAGGEADSGHHTCYGAPPARLERLVG
jgi:hypothetical protein